MLNYRGLPILGLYLLIAMHSAEALAQPPSTNTSPIAPSAPETSVTARASIESAEASFKYIAHTLRVFRNTGRLVNNPGIDGADLEAFVEYLDIFYHQFSAGFNSASALCAFYLDPENGRMTIEDRAQLSFSFLRQLDSRLALYIAVDKEFQDTLTEEFGSILVRNIDQRKTVAVSNQRLPSAEFDEAAVISFIDTMCI